MLLARKPRLIGNVLIPDDGTGYELRKQRHKGTEADIVPLNIRIASIDVYGVAHRLEGIEQRSL